MDDFICSAARSTVTELEYHPEFLNLMLIELVEFKTTYAPLLLEKIIRIWFFFAERMAVLKGDVRTIPAPLLLHAFIDMFFSYCITDTLLNNLILSEMLENVLDAVQTIAQIVSYVLPLRYYLSIIRVLLLNGVGLEMIMHDVITLTIFGAVIIGAAAL